MNMDRAEPGLPAKVYPALHGRRGFRAPRVSRRHQYTNRAASANLSGSRLASRQAWRALACLPCPPLIEPRCRGMNPGGAWRGVCVERSVPSGRTAFAAEVVRPARWARKGFISQGSEVDDVAAVLTVLNGANTA